MSIQFCLTLSDRRDSPCDRYTTLHYTLLCQFYCCSLCFSTLSSKGNLLRANLSWSCIRLVVSKQWGTFVTMKLSSHSSLVKRKRIHDQEKNHLAGCRIQDPGFNLVFQITGVQLSWNISYFVDYIHPLWRYILFVKCDAMH